MADRRRVNTLSGGLYPAGVFFPFFSSDPATLGQSPVRNRPIQDEVSLRSRYSGPLLRSSRLGHSANGRRRRIFSDSLCYNRLEEPSGSPEIKSVPRGLGTRFLDVFPSRPVPPVSAFPTIPKTPMIHFRGTEHAV